MSLLQTWHQLHFIRPLWLGALPALWALCGWLALRRHPPGGSWAGLIDAELLPLLRLAASSDRVSRLHWLWLALVWTLAALALAGPSWHKDVSSAWRAPASWVVVLDLSPSMAATDLSPSRAVRARYAIDDLLGAARDSRVGLVAFSDEPYTVTPLTDDIATIRNLLPSLAPDIMPTPGDRLAPALDQAATLLGPGRNRHVIVLSDGFSDPTAAFPAAERLRQQGIVVDVVGIGTLGGAPMPGGNGHFAQDAMGRPLVARLDPDQLGQLARAGGGRYVDLAGMADELARLQAGRDLPGGAALASNVEVDHWQDSGFWLLPLVLVLAALIGRRGWA